MECDPEIPKSHVLLKRNLMQQTLYGFVRFLNIPRCFTRILQSLIREHVIKEDIEKGDQMLAQRSKIPVTFGRILKGSEGKHRNSTDLELAFQ